MGMSVAATDMELLTPEEQQAQQEMERLYGLPIQTNELSGWPQGPGTYGEAGIVMEVGSGAILYAKNIDDHHYPASITKTLTTLVAMENSDLRVGRCGNWHAGRRCDFHGGSTLCSASGIS